MPQFPLRTWFQLGLFPALLLIFGLLGGDLIFEMRRLILNDFDRELRATGKVTAAFVDSEAHERLMRLEADAAEKLGEVPLVVDGWNAAETYQEGVAPLRRIRERLGLTYLYTQTLGEGDRIIYGLDSMVGEDYTPFGTQDELPPDEVPGVERLVREGVPHSTQLRRWDNWGMLKAVFIPFFDPAGRVVGMVGADVDVLVVEHRTRHVLLMVLGGGALALLLASYWSWRVARSIRSPLERFRQGALQVAVGDYREFTIRGPNEVENLAAEFRQLSKRVRDTGLRVAAQAAAARARALWEHRDRRLRADWQPQSVENLWPGVAVRGNQGGARRVGDLLVLWWASPPASNDAGGVLAEQVVARSVGRDRANRVGWPRGVGGVAVVEVKTRRLRWCEGDAAAVQARKAGLRLGSDAVGFAIDLPGAAWAEGGAG